MQIIFCCFFRYCTVCAKNQQKIIFMLHANYFLLIFMCIDIVREKSTKNNLHLCAINIFPNMKKMICK